MRLVQLIVEYDGTDFVGWQVQRNGRTVQEELEKALRTMLGVKVSAHAAGRTDAGVHALGQVVVFEDPRGLPMQAFSRGLNGVLPDDIAVVDAFEAPEGFDPRRWAKGKHYRYLISNRRRRSPLRRRTHWEVFTPLDLAAMQAAALPLIGRHDFSAFRASDCQAKNAVREIRALNITRGEDAQLVFDVEGTAFLKHMVRNLVGSLVEVGRGKQPVRWVEEVLASRDRTRAGPTAPPQGLTMMSVRYEGRPASGEAAPTDDGD